MLRIGIVLTLAIAAAFAVDLAAQPPGDDRDNDRDRPAAEGDNERGRTRDGERRRGDFDRRRDFGRRGDRDGRRGFRMPPPPLMRVLDADHNGELSAKEVKNASKALSSLDRNGDKKLSREELRPRFDRRGRRPGPPREFSSEEFVERFLQRDENEDGKISKEEYPERWRDHFDRVDGNDDGFLDRAELKRLAEHFAARINRGPGDGRGDRDNRDRDDHADRPDRDGDAPEDDPDSITRDDL